MCVRARRRSPCARTPVALPPTLRAMQQQQRRQQQQWHLTGDLGVQLDRGVIGAQGLDLGQGHRPLVQLAPGLRASTGEQNARAREDGHMRNRRVGGGKSGTRRAVPQPCVLTVLCTRCRSRCRSLAAPAAHPSCCLFPICFLHTCILITSTTSAAVTLHVGGCQSSARMGGHVGSLRAPCAAFQAAPLPSSLPDFCLPAEDGVLLAHLLPNGHLTNGCQRRSLLQNEG